jgi:predicted outer membrane repeat protein
VGFSTDIPNTFWRKHCLWRRVVGDGTPGSCTESALNTALSSASSIKFDCGGEHTITLSTQKTIDTDTTIDGGGLITLSGGGSTRLFNVLNGAQLTLQGLTIANGFSKNDGGAVYVERLSKLTVNESTFQSNTGYNGGGIATNGWGWDDDGVVLNISDSTFSNNIATAPAIAGGGNGGGGIYLSGGSTGTVVNSSFSNNQSSNGGAIHLLHSNLKVTNVYFSNNKANNAVGGGGGAIYMDGTKGLNGEVRIELSTFDGNSTNQLGGSFFSFPEGSGGAFIDQSTFNGNISNNRGQGGAIYHQSATGNGPLFIDNSTFMNNKAVAIPLDASSSGGALWLLDAPVTITNSTFTQNDATHSQNETMDPTNWRRGFGGAIRTSENTTIVNTTIANNTAGFVGGAIAGGASVRNMIVAHNSGNNPWRIQQNCTDEVIDSGKNIQYPKKTTNLWNDYECFGAQAAVDPLLGVLEDYGGPTLTIPLQTDSPAIDAAASCPISDQRGYPRDGPCDIGAYEFGGGIIITNLSPSGSGLNDIQDITLAVRGAGFGVNSIVRWAGSSRPTNYTSSFLVKAEITANDLDTVGVYSVTVYDPDRSLESEPMIFNVVPFVAKDYLPFL